MNRPNDDFVLEWFILMAVYVVLWLAMTFLFK